jgi:hypothetical protein
MSQNKIKQTNDAKGYQKTTQFKAAKHTVKEVLASIEWSVEDDQLMLLSRISDEYITIDLQTIINKNNG